MIDAGPGPVFPGEKRDVGGGGVGGGGGGGGPMGWEEEGGVGELRISLQTPLLLRNR